MKKLLCKIGIHLSRGMHHKYLGTIDGDTKKSWVILVCTDCKTIWRIGLAHQRTAEEGDKATPIPEGYTVK